MNGYLYVAFGIKYLKEVEISAKSLKRFTQYPICLVTDDTNFSCEFVDQILITKKETDFVSKIIGLQQSPFDATVFLDSDTFICGNIDGLFSILDKFEMAMAIEKVGHSIGFIEKYHPGFKIRYQNLIPEYHTAVIVLRNNEKIKNFIAFWLKTHLELGFKADMPSLREALLDFEQPIFISPLLGEYNFIENFSYGILYNEVKIIHGRFGERWNTLTSIMLPFDKMDKIAKKYNQRANTKRVVLAYLGIISSNYNLRVIKAKIKSLLGVKRTKKSETF